MHKITYVATGSVRGECGHTHNTIQGAAKCALKDHRACRRLGGGAYSDRTVERRDGEPLSADECGIADDIINPEK